MEIRKDMTIGEVVNKYPESATVMLGYGLHCVGCAVNPYETIENGCMGHGMDEETINKLVGDLNNLASKSEDKRRDNEGKTVIITEFAASKLNQFMDEENKNGCGVKLNVVISKEGLMQYGLEFAKRPNTNEEIFEEKKIKVFVEKNVVNMIKGTEIDYIDNENGSGFKINNPKVENSGCGTGCGCH